MCKSDIGCLGSKYTYIDTECHSDTCGTHRRSTGGVFQALEILRHGIPEANAKLPPNLESDVFETILLCLSSLGHIYTLRYKNPRHLSLVLFAELHKSME